MHWKISRRALQKIIMALDIVVENRVPLKCRDRCIGYGKKLTRPPYVTGPDELRKILAEYRMPFS
jgi:predicted metal-binding protein